MVFKEKPMVALSTCDAEYLVGALFACQVVWLMNLVHELKFKVSKPVRLMIDNKSGISLAKNPVLHGRSRNIGT